MDDQEYIAELNSEMRKLYMERDKAKRKMERIERSITELSAEKNNLQKLPPIKMGDEELLYAIRICLNKMGPASKAFEESAIRFGKEPGWSKRIVRYRPFSDQLDRVFSELESQQCQELRLIKEFGLINNREIKSAKTFSEMLNKLKSALRIAKRLHSKNAQIQVLEEEVNCKKREVESLKQALAESLSLNPKQRVFELKRQFPHKNFSEIAEMTDLSRQTVSTYLKQATSH